MSAADFLYKVLPSSQFKKLRKWYYGALQKRYKPLTEEQFRELLIDKLGLGQGQTVFIHSAISKMNLGFPVFKVLNILQEVTGAEGTLLFPAWQYQGSADEYLKQHPNAVFDVAKTPTAMGLLPELVRRHPGAVRSLHPTTSIAAIGKHAEELLSTHHLSLQPCGIQSPYYKMIPLHARIIGLGEKTVSLSFVHCVEDAMQGRFPMQTLEEQPVRLNVIDKERHSLEIETYLPSKNIQQRDIPGFMKKHITSDACRSIKFHGVNYFTVDAMLLFSEMQTLAENGVTIYR